MDYIYNDPLGLVVKSSVDLYRHLADVVLSSHIYLLYLSEV